MDTRTKVVLLDGFLGLVQLATALVFAGPGALVEHWWLVVVAALGTAGFATAGDRGYTLDDSAWEFAIVLVALVAVSVLVVLVTDPPVSTVGALLFGVGTGILTYRLVFGVIRPVPARRIEQARDRTV